MQPHTRPIFNTKVVEIISVRGKVKWRSRPVISIHNSRYPSLTLFELQQYSAVTGVAAEVASALVIPKQHVLPELQLLGPLQPLRLQRGLVQVERATNDEGIVIQEAGDRRRSGERSGRRQMKSGRRARMRALFIKNLLIDQCEKCWDGLLLVN